MLCTSPLFARVEDHFKKISDNSGMHQMRNIDFIYMINLDERPEKFASSSSQLTPYGIFPLRFSAVNGWKLTLEDINDVGLVYDSWMESGVWGTYYPLDGGGKSVHEIVGTEGRTYFSHTMARGPIGIVLSHLSVLQDAYDAGYNTVWVMEDDIQVLRDPHLISTYIDKLDALVGVSGWDILFTDKDTKNQDGDYVPCTAYAWRPNYTPENPKRFVKKKKVSADFRQVGARYGAYSMIVRRSGMRKILEFIKAHKIFLPYDMDLYMPSSVKMFTLFDDVVSTQPRAISDNGKPNYENK